MRKGSTIFLLTLSCDNQTQKLMKKIYSAEVYLHACLQASYSESCTDTGLIDTLNGAKEAGVHIDVFYDRGTMIRSTIEKNNPEKLKALIEYHRGQRGNLNEQEKEILEEIRNDNEELLDEEEYAEILALFNKFYSSP